MSGEFREIPGSKKMLFYGLALLPLLLIVIATSEERGSFASLALAMFSLVLSGVLVSHGGYRIRQSLKIGEKISKLITPTVLSSIPIFWWLWAWLTS